MFLLNQKPLALDTPFTVGKGDAAIQFPSNWLRLSTPEEKTALGITEAPDPVVYDDRFYWAPGVPKDLDMLQCNIVAQVKTTAASLLAPTDWRIVRAAEGVKPCDDATLAARAAIRAASDANEVTVLACATVDELAALQMAWPTQD